MGFEGLLCNLVLLMATADDARMYTIQDGERHSKRYHVNLGLLMYIIFHIATFVSVIRKRR